MKIKKKHKEKSFFPPLGNRIIKTTTAVFLCLLLHAAVGYRGSALQAAIAAIICIQPYASDTRTFAVERVIGTCVGSVWGFLYLFLLLVLPGIDRYMVLAYLVMALFVLMALYSAILIRKASAAAQIAIVFLGIVITYPEVNVTPLQALGTVLETLVGTLIAILVNATHLPREKHREKLFFVRTMDLVPDRYTHLPSAVHYMLDYLYSDGAKICLISRWAPAFIISQMGLLNVNAPVIVMDGAGLYDAEANKYLEVTEIPKKNAEKLRRIIRDLGAGCSFYTVCGRSLCIYRDGPQSEAEQAEYAIMKKSPYRNYLEGEYREEDKIAFMRVIDTPEKIAKLVALVKKALPQGMFRIVERREAQFPDYNGLYFYAPNADVPHMKEKVLKYMEEKEKSQLKAVDIRPRRPGYSPEHEAMILLSRLKNAYEPVSVRRLFRRKENERLKKD